MINYSYNKPISKCPLVYLIWFLSRSTKDNIQQQLDKGVREFNFCVDFVRNDKLELIMNIVHPYLPITYQEDVVDWFDTIINFKTDDKITIKIKPKFKIQTMYAEEMAKHYFNQVVERKNTNVSIVFVSED